MPQKIKSFDVLRTTNEENENGYELLLKELVLQRFFCRGRQILSVYHSWPVVGIRSFPYA